MAMEYDPKSFHSVHLNQDVLEKKLINKEVELKDLTWQEFAILNNNHVPIKKCSGELTMDIKDACILTVEEASPLDNKELLEIKERYYNYLLGRFKDSEQGLNITFEGYKGEYHDGYDKFIRSSCIDVSNKFLDLLNVEFEITKLRFKINNE